MLMNDDEPPAYAEPPELHGRHLLTCRTIWYDPRRPEAGFSLGGVYVHVEPPEGDSFPIRLDLVFIYFQLRGDQGEYRLRIRFVSIVVNDDGDEEEIQLGRNGEPREFSMPGTRLVSVSGIEYVEQIVFRIGPIPFADAGLYEYQLWAEGYGKPITRERVLARE